MCATAHYTDIDTFRRRVKPFAGNPIPGASSAQRASIAGYPSPGYTLVPPVLFRGGISDVCITEYALWPGTTAL